MNADNEQIIIKSKVDKPKSQQLNDTLELKKIEECTKRKKDKRDYRKELTKFKTGRNIVYACLSIIVLFYISESFFTKSTDVQFKITIIEPVKFVLTATIGYIFAEYTNNKK